MALQHKFVTYGTGPNGIQWRWVNYYRTAADFTPTQAQMTAWITAMWNAIKASIGLSVSVYGIGYAPYEGDELNDPKGWGATIVYPVTLAGTFNGDIMPGQVAAVILGRTATKRVIAKKFVFGTVEQEQSAGVAAAPLTTNLANLGGLMYASTYDMGGTALTPCAWGVKHGFTPTVSASLSPYLGTQRRRKPGVGI